MVIYQKGKTPFILRFLTVFISPGTWILSGFGAVIFYLAGTEKPPMSTGMYIVAGIVALLVYGIVHAHWVEVATKLVLIEIVPSGLRIQQLKYDTLHEVIIEAAQFDLAATRYRYTRRNQNTRRCTLTISNKDETHSFTVRGDEEFIGQMLEKISEQKVIELRANENDFITRYKENINSVSTKVANVIVYGVRTALVVGILIGGYMAYKSYVEGGFMSELVGAIRHYQNEEPTAENNNVYQSLVDFPRKWFPLYESEGGLVRQQLCGSEAHIEIFERDGHDIWSEHGYQDLLERPITDFVIDAEGKYILTVQSEGGGTSQITILVVDPEKMVYSIDEKTYTPNPDSFMIENDTEECL
ncbi:MAG: hypothetical protein KBF45_00905 [Cyclobacteriaceae bacterium]|jgi:hypothetical protein|nr:hypothetical protein [Cyclobacteriaceae bacterium]